MSIVLFEKELQELVGIMRYCYSPLPSKVNEEEWKGSDYHEGTKHLVRSYFYNVAKKFYILGFCANSKRVCHEMEKDYDMTDAMIGAERAFNEDTKTE